MPSFYAAIDLQKNELRQPVIQNLGSAPSSPVKGQLYMDTTANILYFYDGTVWVSTKSSGGTPASTVTTQAVGDTAVVGTSTNYAREDHKHGREGFGAVTAETTFGAGSANGSAATIAHSDHTHGNPTHDDAAHAAIHLNALAAPNATVNMGLQRIMNLADPSLVNDAATKQYVDNSIAGLSWKDAARCATTANITLSGNQTIDGVATSSNDRVLVKNQTTASQNGLYLASSSGWVRTNDADVNTEIEQMAVFVMEGSTQADTAWVCTTNSPITVGTTSLAFAQFNGGASYTAGAGLTLTGNVFDVVAGDTSLIVNADELHVNTAVIATVASLSAYGKKYAGALTGTASPETVTHNLNTRDILLTVLNGASPYTAVELDWDATTVNTATIRYNPNLGAGYRVVVMG